MSIRLVWVDVETTGLEPRRDFMVELGIMITDSELVLVDQKSWIIEINPRAVDSMDPVVKDMHRHSGLMTALMVGNFDGTVEQVEKQAITFLDQHDAENLPMCGSSVHFDRGFLKQHMPRLESMFHYRNIDVSTMKNLWAIYQDSVDGAPPGRKIHRVMDDLVDSVNELRWYLTSMGWL